MISLVGVGPTPTKEIIVHFHGNIYDGVYEELYCLHFSSSFMQDIVSCHKAKTVLFSWRGRNSCYEEVTTKPKYESYRE